MQKLLDILNGLHSDVDFENTDGLVDNGILDSFDMVTLVMEINEAYGVEISVLDITPENFNTVKSIFELISNLS